MSKRKLEETNFNNGIFKKQHSMPYIEEISQAEKYFQNLKVASQITNESNAHRHLQDKLGKLKAQLSCLSNKFSEKQPYNIYIGFFGESGSGKSSKINELIGLELLPNASPLETEGMYCTSYPVICFFTEKEYFEIVPFYRTVDNGERRDISKFATAEITKNKLIEIMKINDKNILYYKILIPKNCLERNRKFLAEKSISLIDTIGVPDNNISDAYELNSKIILEEDLDLAFILKDSGRGNINEYDIDALFKSDVLKLKKCSMQLYMTYPKIVAVFKKDDESNLDKLHDFTRNVKKRLQNDLKKCLNMNETDTFDNQLQDVILSSFDKNEIVEKADSMIWLSQKRTMSNKNIDYKIEDITLESIKKMIDEIDKLKRRNLLYKFYMNATECNTELFELLKRSINTKCQTGRKDFLIYNFLYTNIPYQHFCTDLIAKMNDQSEKIEALFKNCQIDDQDQNLDCHNSNDSLKFRFRSDLEEFSKIISRLMNNNCMRIQKNLGLKNKNVIIKIINMDYNRLFEKYLHSEKSFKDVANELKSEVSKQNYCVDILNKFKNQIFLYNLESDPVLAKEYANQIRCIKENQEISKKFVLKDSMIEDNNNLFEKPPRKPLLRNLVGANVLPFKIEKKFNSHKEKFEEFSKKKVLY